jgi:hypothetical protein
MGAGITGSCRELQEIKYVPLPSQYIHSLVLFVINKKNNLHLSLRCIAITLLNRPNIHQPLSILISYQQGLYYFGIKVCSCLPEHVKNLSHNMKQFISPLMGYLDHSFYSLDKYFNYNKG